MLPILLVSLLLSSGCSSDDDGSGGFLPSCLLFTPTLEPVDGTVTARTGDDSDCDLLELELVVTGVDDVFGASFKLTYPVVNTQFIGPVDVSDSLLGQDGVTVIVVASEETPGEVTVALTRDGSQSEEGVPADATNNVLARLLFFRITSSGSGDVAFEDADLFGPGMPPVAKSIPFSGGTFNIEQ